MANTLRFKRGLASGIPTGVAGEPLFTTDTFDLYIGNGATNTRFQKYIASGTTSQLLRGDGSLLTMPIVLTSPANGEVLKYNGTTWVNSSDAGITGSGLAGQVAYFTGATTQAGNNNLFWDATNNRLGIGTASLFTPLTVATTNTRFEFSEVSSILHAIESINTARSTSTELGLYNRAFRVFTRPSGTGSYTNHFTITDNGRLLLGSTSDSGQRLQVTGDTLLKGSGNTSATTALTVQNSAAATMMSISNDAATTILNITGSTASAFQVNQTTANRSAYFATASTGVEFGCGTAITYYQFVNGGGSGLLKLNTTPLPTTGGNLLELPNAGAPFQPTSGTAIFTTLLMQPTINQTGGANGGTRGLYVNPTLTAAADWRSIEWSNNSGWGLYGAGTAPNFILGNLGIGSTTINGVGKILSIYNPLGNDVQIRLQGTISGQTSTDGGLISLGSDNSMYFYNYENAPIIFGTNNSLIARFTQLGNLNIGTFTSDSGEKLQVTGSARFTNPILVNSAGTVTSGFSNGINLGTWDTLGYDASDVVLGGYRASQWQTIRFYTLGTERMRLNSSGNLGLGITPSAWLTTDTKVLQLGASAFYSQVFGGNYGTVITSNYFQNSVGAYIFLNNGRATDYYQSNGIHAWRTSTASGTAGGTVTFTQAMTLTALNNLLVGSTSDSGERLQVTGTAKITGNLAVDTNTLFVDATNNRVGIGTTTPSEPLHVLGNALITGNVAVGATGGAVGSLQIIKTGGTPISNQIVFGTDGSGYQLAIGKNQVGTITNYITLQDNGNLAVDSNVLFVDAVNNEVGIGTNAPNSSLQVVGSVSKSISDVKTANYTATATDHTILCSAASGGITITLPAASGIAGRIYVIKKTNASSGVNSVTVDGNGAETIDGSASINLACKSSVMLQCDGSNWHILSLYTDTSCL